MIKFFRFLILFLFCYSAFLPQLIQATVLKGGENIVIPESTLIQDDYFIAGNNIKFSGKVEGDFVSASKTLTSKGVIGGNLMSVARDLDISGEVGGSFRGGAQNISLDGKLKRNFLGFAANINLKDNSEIGGDVIAFCGELKISGKVGKGVKGSVGSVVISGVIDGDVNIQADEISIMPDAKINGNLFYKSKKEAKIEKGAQITGETKWTKVIPKKKKGGGLTGGKLLIKFLFLCASIVTGLFMLLVAKKEVKAVKESIFKDFLKNLGLGFVFVICVPVAAIILHFTVIGIPVSIIVLFVYLVLFYMAKIFFGFALGEKVLMLFKTNGTPAPVWSLIIGLLILYILFLVPYIHWIVYLLVLFVGFGSVFQIKKYLVPISTAT
ncbi:MAG: polymer-forming cytoskeletal protein [candidate division Zixibacteria bacterium]|nr:polymer-forming cytoskeletal protein [candidate division Zixibacteria bacterium]